MKELKNWEALRALEEGQEVEYRYHNVGGWNELNKYHEFPFANMANVTYRLKPDELPKTWEALKSVEGSWVDSNSEMYSGKLSNPLTLQDRNIFATKEQAEASIALAQLSQLMQVYNDGWSPYWEGGIKKFTIEFLREKIIVDHWTIRHRFLTFKTDELRDLFLKNFRDLIETAKPLL